MILFAEQWQCFSDKRTLKLRPLWRPGTASGREETNTTRMVKSTFKVLCHIWEDRGKAQCGCILEVKGIGAACDGEKEHRLNPVGPWTSSKFQDSIHRTLTLPRLNWLIMILWRLDHSIIWIKNWITRLTYLAKLFKTHVSLIRTLVFWACLQLSANVHPGRQWWQIKQLGSYHLHRRPGSSARIPSLAPA